jgi:hypothetical protein
MRWICGLIGLAAAAVAVTSASALDVPTLPQPTVTTPTLPTPTLPTPTLPAPTVPTPTVPSPTLPAPTLPAPTVPTPTVPSPTLPASTLPAPTLPAPRVPGATAPTTQPVSAPAGARAPEPAPAPTAASPSGGAPATPASRAARAAHGGTTRSASRQLRPVVATFHVRRALVVRVTVRQLEPRCRAIGRYRYRAERGVNRIRLPGQIGHRRLGAGVYVLVGRTAQGRRIFRVVTDVRRSSGRLLAHRVAVAPTCAAAAAPVGVLAAGAPFDEGSRSASSKMTPRAIYKPPAVAFPGKRRPPLVRAATLEDAPAPLRPLLYALLAVAIGLLAAAAAPQRMLPAGTTGAFVADKRLQLAAAGIWLVAVVAVLTIFA